MSQEKQQGITTEAVEPKTSNDIYLLNARDVTLAWLTKEGHYYAGDDVPAGARIAKINLSDTAKVVQISDDPNGRAQLAQRIEMAIGAKFAQRLISPAPEQVGGLDGQDVAKWRENMATTYDEALATFKALDSLKRHPFGLRSHEVKALERLHSAARVYTHAFAALVSTLAVTDAQQVAEEGSNDGE